MGVGGGANSETWEKAAALCALDFLFFFSGLFICSPVLARLLCPVADCSFPGSAAIKID